MIRSLRSMHLGAAALVAALFAGDAAAIPLIRPAVPRPTVHAPAPGARPAGNRGKTNKGKNKNANAKSAGPLETAIKDLQSAQTDLEARNNSGATQKARAAEQIVAQQAKQARGAGGDKDRATKLDDVSKDIREAEKQIAARKTDDANTALQSAVASLQTLDGRNGAAKPKKKKKN